MMNLSNENEVETLDDLLQKFILDINNYIKIKNLFFETMSRGLDLETRQASSIKMFPSYVTKIPNGKELGKYLALHFDSSFCYILLIIFTGKKAPRLYQRYFNIPTDVMLGTGEELFDYIAEGIQVFVAQFGLQKERLKLGFTFSFPCLQHGLLEAYLVRWTKGISASGVEGKNVSKLLQNALDKAKLKIKCFAVVNDAVGTLAYCAFIEKQCYMSLIVDSGTNAAYIEDVVNVPMMSNMLVKTGDIMNHTPTVISHKERVIINTEWGAFGDNGELDEFRNEYDKAVDADSNSPGRQIFEKLCSGMYLGELVRLFCVDLVKKGFLFHGVMPKEFLKRNTFLSDHIFETERDAPNNYQRIYSILTNQLGVKDVNENDCALVRVVCELVSKRAAYLLSAGICSVLQRVNQPFVIIAVDGFYFKTNSLFRTRIANMIEKLKPNDVKFHLKQCSHSGGKGAAMIVAAIANETN